MRIGIFTNNYAPIISGVTTSILNFRKGLEAEGHDVFIFAPEFKGHEETDRRVFRYPSAPFEYKAKYPVPLPSITDKEFLEKAKLDIIHSQHPWGVGATGYRLARKNNIPIVFTNHAMYGVFIDYLPPVLPRNMTVDFIESSAVRYANKVDAVISPTESIKQYLRHVGVKNKIHTVPSGFDAEKLNKDPDFDLRKKYKIPKEHKILMNVSRIGPEKNLPTLLRAHRRVIEKEPETTLVIVGGGVFLNELKALASRIGIEDKTVFTDTVQLEDVGDYYKQADIFVYSSVKDAQGLVMVEAMATGLPVIAAKATGVVDLVKDGVNGYITVDTPKGLADKILLLIQEEAKLKKLSAGALETSKAYTIPETTEKLLKVYNSIL